MRRPLTLRRTAAALVVPLALSSLVACGSESDEPSGSSAASDPGLEKGEEMPVEDFAEILEAALEGATTAAVTMTTSGGQADVEMTGDIDYSTTPPSSKMTVQDETTGEVELISLGAVSYVKSPDLGGKYMKIDLSGAMESLSGNGLGLDPGSSMENMKKGMKSVVHQGEEEVDGEDLTRYTLTLDTKAMLGDELGAVGGVPEEMAYDIWFDEDGLYRRVEADLGSAAGTMTMTLSDWGKDVSIEEPPADQVTEMPEMPQMPSTPPSAG
ncbi:LppX_LprAFG lipoprotein [Nocardioides solisilvae]|uniref:LppX_LprAFG lipoprotein n=1 Tax=Nocardioides solisilvae TaxID=1542435 RepID=UPI000D74D026|nr:LppX_LprAFG lipoprotein [Nocardioides solisilvae]